MHDYIGNSYLLLCSHPADFTPVCTTELAQLSLLATAFAARGVKVAALSCDTVENHVGWSKDIQTVAGQTDVALPYTIISDPKREIATALGMLDADEKDKHGLPVTARSVFFVGPDKKLKFSILYPATSGRNMDEIVRVIDSILLTTAYPKVATPANWRPGEACMVQPSVPEEELAALFPGGVTHVAVPSGKRYLRLTPAPDVVNAAVAAAAAQK